MNRRRTFSNPKFAHEGNARVNLFRTISALTPLLMCVSVCACGLMMLGILPFNQEGRGMLILFSVVMLGLAAAMLFLMRRTERQDEVQERRGVDKH